MKTPSENNSDIYEKTEKCLFKESPKRLKGRVSPTSNIRHKIRLRP